MVSAVQKSFKSHNASNSAETMCRIVFIYGLKLKLEMLSLNFKHHALPTDWLSLCCLPT